MCIWALIEISFESPPNSLEWVPPTLLSYGWQNWGLESVNALPRSPLLAWGRGPRFVPCRAAYNHTPHVGLNRWWRPAEVGGVPKQPEAPWRRAHICYTVCILPRSLSACSRTRGGQYRLTAGSFSGGHTSGSPQYPAQKVVRCGGPVLTSQ